MQPKSINYLALGDSYTIGESVPFYENFPNQVVQLLRKKNENVNAAEILAKTGWTTSELLDAIKDYRFSQSYDYVSLLIGVNNQYRSQSLEQYENEFEILLKKAISLASDKTDHVIVLSIPDWGVTPFAGGRDRKEIASAIDLFNSTNKSIAAKYKVQYIDITNWTREAAENNSLIAKDGLHPSSVEYKRWAEKIAQWILSQK
jgi:lysophospholipase L1-like esterase